MTNQRFWEIVDSVDWPREDYEAAKVQILMNTAPAEVKELQDELNKRREKLDELFDEAYDEVDEDFYVSEDGLNDCFHHIIGLGELTYESCVENPMAIVDRYRAGEYTESFSYAIPHATDYEKLGSGYYQFRSTKYVSCYDEIARNEKFSDEYRRKASWMKDVLKAFPYLREATNQLEYADRIEESSKEALLDWMYKTEEELSDDINGWPVRNLVSDYRTYYIYNQ